MLASYSYESNQPITTCRVHLRVVYVNSMLLHLGPLHIGPTQIPLCNKNKFCFITILLPCILYIVYNNSFLYVRIYRRLWYNQRVEMGRGNSAELLRNSGDNNDVVLRIRITMIPSYTSLVWFDYIRFI